MRDSFNFESLSCEFSRKSVRVYQPGKVCEDYNKASSRCNETIFRNREGSSGESKTCPRLFLIAGNLRKLDY